MAHKTTMVHVTHEAVGKIGGIGAVLEGFFTCNSYLETVERSIIIGPLFSADGPVLDRLGEDGKVLYCSADRLANTKYAQAFREIENYYNVDIVYGKRTFVDKQTGITSSPEVLLIDVRYMDNGPINEFKKCLFEEFGIRSDLYENIWEYEQYVRLAPAAIGALKAIGAAKESTIVVSHEFMGMPTALAAISDSSCNWKTAFYAHEAATMRRIVEEHPGHDTMFYNVLKQAHNDNLYVNEVFGEQSSYFKHALIENSRHCDTICAVGDYVVDELRFLAPEFKAANIDIVYNGIPAYQIDVADKLNSKRKLQQYCENLLGYKPDFVFTHVTRLVQSKGLWRDLRILEKIEKEFRAQDKTAVFILLSTQAAQRRSHDIYNMESTYNWPVAHREGEPDMSEGEASFYTTVQEFNAKSRNIKTIFINQFGFEPKYCGRRMPEDMEFMDIRKGSDVEFGLSIYEPFGIAQLESLSFGGICVLSNVCGSAGFVRDVTGGKDVRGVIIADYTNLDNGGFSNIEEMLQIGESVRSQIEDKVSQRIAAQIIGSLPKSNAEIESLIESGYSVAKKMSWDVVVKNYVLPSCQKALHSQHKSIYMQT